MNRIFHIINPFILAGILLLFSLRTNAQLQVNAGISAQSLAEAIAGPGVIIENPQINGAPVSYGSYSTINTSLPFSNGVLLTTGKAINAIGPNNVQHKSYINSFAGSPLLDSAMNQVTHDACTFEFDIVPQGDSILFNFTFASEEYNNFVGSIYSDVFGFFISGPGISGNENIALVPSTTQPVSINTINAVANSTYFFDNDNPEGEDLQYNGYTINLVAKKAVSACESYHLTLVIADANDYSIDSGVFIEKIESPNASLSSATAGGISYMVEGCNDGTVTFTRLSSNLSQDITITYYLGGTAVNGVDYIPQIGSNPDPAVPKTIDILSGQSTASFTVSPVDDNIPNSDKYMAIYLASTTCPDILYDSLFFPIYDSLIVNTSPDTAICAGQSVLLETLDGGSTWLWSPPGSLENPNAANTIATPDSTTQYVLYTTASFCEAWDSSLVVVSNLEVIVDTLKLSCSGYNDGMIAISVLNGIPPYTISWTGPGGFTSSNMMITSLLPGVYSYVVSDAISCTQSGSVTLDLNDPINVSLYSTEISPFNYNITCNGDSSATLYSVVSGGSPEYVYLWSNGVQNTTFLNNQPAGIYSLLVIDSYNCFGRDSITVTQPPPLSLQLDSLQNVDCYGDNSGYIELSASGGVGSYSYNWNTNPPSQGNIQSNLPAGNYNVDVFDAYGCSISASYAIAQPASMLELNIDTIINVTCPGDNNGSITISPIGGTAPYSISWNTSPVQIGPIAANLSPGTYQVTIIDSLGCTLTQNIEVLLLVAPLQANVSSKNNVLCYGDASGSAAITVSGGSGPYSYLWTPGGYTSSSVFGLTAGTYNVSITDIGLCMQSTNITVEITQPADSIDVSLSAPQSNGYNLSCFESNDGSINTALSGGNPPYSYLWNGPNGFSSTNTDLSGLAAGSYFLTVNDQNGCINTDSISLTQPDEITISFVMTPSTCPTPGSNDGSITISVSGGVPGYTFNWTGPNGFNASNQDISNLEAGVYTLVIEDAIACSESFNITVTQPDNFTVDPFFSSYNGGWNVSCFSYADGEIAVAVGNATLPVQYSWIYEGAEISTDTFITNVEAGNYELIITDANNCIENRFYTLDEPDSILIDFDAFSDAFGNSISCYGESDGELTATISGGTPAYSWLWTYPDNSTSSNVLLQNLPAATYSLEITDQNNCIGFDSIQIYQPDTLTISLSSPDSNGVNVMCFNGNDGSIITDINGGTPPYTFIWVYPGGGIGSTDQNPGNLQAGTYILNASDANGCTATDTITLVASDPISYTTIISDYNGYALPCEGDSIAQVEIIPQGGTPPYSILWNDGASTFIRTNLSAGSYGGLIYDSMSCIGTFTVDIIEPQAILVDFTISNYGPNYQIQCNGDSSGSIYMAISGGAEPYLINWTGPNAYTSSSDSISNLIAGSYDLLISDVNNCTYSQQITLNEPTSIALTISQLSYSNCAADSNSSLIVVANGGSGDFNYVWTGPNGFSSTNSFIDHLSEGHYCVEVTDQNGCLANACFDIADPLPLLLTLTSPEINGVNVLCYGDSSASIMTTVSGGIPPYSYTWTGPMGSNPSGSDPSGLIAGVYNLLLTDSLGCTTSQSITITQANPFVSSISISDYNGFGVSCYGLNDGTISISTVNGTAPYTYSWSDINGPVSGSDNLSNLYAGTYYVLISDVNACTQEDSVVIISPDSISITLSSQEYAPGINISCSDGNNGTIEALVDGGVESYSYSWTGPLGYASNDSNLVQLSEGWYFLNLSDQNACMALDSIFLNAPDSALTVDLSIDVKNSGTNISCFGGNDGSVSTHISGGIPPYDVYWLGPNGFSSNDTVMENLYAGIYFLSVVDSAQCTYSIQITLSQPSDSLQANLAVINNTCFGDSSASVLLEALGGSPTYTIAWEGPDGFIANSFLIENLINGQYTYFLSDTNACQIQDSISITSAAAIQANEVQQNIDCYGSANGSIILNPSGGGNSYTYDWSGPNGFSSDQATINNLDSGEYCVNIISDLFCTADFCFTISESDSLIINDSLVDPSCGYANGAIYLSLSGASPPFTVDWGFQSGADLVNIPAGDYTAVISDSFGCSITQNYQLMGPESLSIADSVQNISCYGLMDGSIEIVIMGGTPPYEVLWIGPNGFNSDENNIDSLAGGNYQLTVIDSLGCSQQVDYQIIMPDAIQVELYSPFYDNGYNVSAYGVNDGSIETVSLVGGTLPYEILWTGPEGYTNANQTFLNDLLGGTYYVQITDINQCAVVDSILLTQPGSLILPTGFTPNNDGYNDYYVVPGITAGNPASIKIYNRWGNIVFESSSYDNNWNGTGKTGENLPEGTYFVIVEFEKDAISLNGYIDLRR